MCRYSIYNRGMQSNAPGVPSKRINSWLLGSRKIEFGNLPVLMGIVNVTPDSFSDGGRYFAHETAIARAIALIDQGAGVIDIGGESTRPYAEAVSADEELGRVLPVIAAVRRERPNAVVSIDTSKAVVAEAALAAGAEIINDVTGLTGDARMVEVARVRQAGVCVMHMQGTPQTMQDDPQYTDAVSEIRNYLRERRDALVAAGVERERLCLDPGIGFGKTHAHNIELMSRCSIFHDLGQPLLVGHSRKAFLGKLMNDKEADRTFATIGGALALARQGVQIIRVHDVQAVREALLVFAACGGVAELAQQ